MKSFEEHFGPIIVDDMGRQIDLSIQSILGSRFIGRQYADVDFTQIDVIGVMFEECSFQNCSFYETAISGSEFRACSFQDVDFEFANVDAVNFDDCMFSSCSFKHSWGQELSFRRCSFLNTELLAKDFYQVSNENNVEFLERLSELDLSTSSNLSECQWWSAEIREVVAIGVDFSRSQLVNCDLSNSVLLSTDFTNAAIVDCDLESAVLSWPTENSEVLPTNQITHSWQQTAKQINVQALQHNTGEAPNGTRWPEGMSPGPGNTQRASHVMPEEW